MKWVDTRFAFSNIFREYGLTIQCVSCFNWSGLLRFNSDLSIFPIVVNNYLYITHLTLNTNTAAVGGSANLVFDFLSTGADSSAMPLTGLVSGTLRRNIYRDIVTKKLVWTSGGTAGNWLVFVAGFRIVAV